MIEVCYLNICQIFLNLFLNLNIYKGKGMHSSHSSDKEIYVEVLK